MYVPNQLLVFYTVRLTDPELKSSARRDGQGDSGTRRNYEPHKILSLPECYAVKKKGKCTLVQTLRLCTGRTAYRESRGIVLLFHNHDTRRG